MLEVKISEVEQLLVIARSKIWVWPWVDVAKWKKKWLADRPGNKQARLLDELSRMMMNLSMMVANVSKEENNKWVTDLSMTKLDLPGQNMTVMMREALVPKSNTLFLVPQNVFISPVINHLHSPFLWSLSLFCKYHLYTDAPFPWNSVMCPSDYLTLKHII